MHSTPRARRAGPHVQPRARSWFALASVVAWAFLAVLVATATATASPPSPGTQESLPTGTSASYAASAFTSHRRVGGGGRSGGSRIFSRPTPRPPPSPVPTFTPTPVAPTTTSPTRPPVSSGFAGGSTPRGRARGLGPLLLASNIGRPGGRGRRFRNEGFEGDDDDCDYIVYIDYDGDDVIDEDNGRRRYRCVEDDNIFSRNPNRQPRTPTSSSGATTDTCTRVGAAAAAAAGAAAFLAL